MLAYVGTYTEPIRFGTGKILEGKGVGIYAYRLDQTSGALDLVETTPGVANPSYLAFDPGGRFLYAVNELKIYEGRASGTVSAFAVDPASGRLQLLNKQLTHGTDPCHVAVDARGRHVFVANFMSGSVCVLPVRGDGALSEASDFIAHQGSGVDPERQAGPHAHAVTLDRTGRFAFVPDLGLDKLFVYRFDHKRGMLEPHAIPWIKMRPGAGPRAVALHPGGKVAYLVNELSSTVAVLSFNGRTASFEELQVVATLPEDFRGQSTCADIQVAPSGLFVYASNRGHDSLAMFRADRRTGRLALIGHEPTQGNTPRSFAIDPSGRFLLAANQDSDSIVTFRIDARTGRLSPTGQVARVPTPVCVKFAAMPAGSKPKRG
jgi:6-phosphogluconolactonase